MSERTKLFGTLTGIVGAALLLAAPVPLQAQAPPQDSLVLRVDGMVCSLCAYGAERRLKRLDEVEGVHVDLDAHRVVVTLRPGMTVSDSTLSREIRRAGFALRGVTRFARDRASRGDQRSP